MSFIFYTLTKLDKSEEVLTQLEDGLIITKNLLEEQKRYALSLSILLSEDKEIINSFIQKNRIESFKIVNKKLKHLKDIQNSKVDVQIHNKDLTTYLRSWDISKKDIPLNSFRQGLVKVYKTKKPIVSIELGKRLNIKAISPIIYQNKMIGSIETIVGFEHLTNQIKQRAYELFILLDKKYLDIASKLKNNSTIDKFVLVNNSNSTLLNNLNLSNLNDYGYISSKDMVFSYFSYYDLKQKKLGYILIGIRNKHSIELNNSFEYIHHKQKDSKVIIQ
ncbi:MAG: cache domain-containing protein [Halarcobacter sp.]